VLHTNLGRAQQAEAAVSAVAQAMRSPVTLEYDLDGAGRGHRDGRWRTAVPAYRRGRCLYRE
jgi:seryl-tRNA(Sec) selenium transferase